MNVYIRKNTKQEACIQTLCNKYDGINDMKFELAKLSRHDQILSNRRPLLVSNLKFEISWS